jgi:hypothetical protein
MDESVLGMDESLLGKNEQPSEHLSFMDEENMNSHQNI